MFNNIESERMRKRLDKKDLAAILGVSVETLNEWTKGQRAIPAGKLRALSRLLGRSAEYLLMIYI